MPSYIYKKCVICGQNQVSDKSVAFHRFPKPGSTNILRATAWATFYNPEDEDWSSVDSLIALYRSCKLLCGRHFQDSCYLVKARKKRSKYEVPGTREHDVIPNHDKIICIYNKN
ncbi:THAP domain-containing protein [Phthorimaea operculella]|nr:THAP domain-containing protein [Phthorimaea operculella]